MNHQLFKSCMQVLPFPNQVQSSCPNLSQHVTRYFDGKILLNNAMLGRILEDSLLNLTGPKSEST